MNNFNIIFIGLDTHKTFTQLAVLKDAKFQLKGLFLINNIKCAVKDNWSNQYLRWLTELILPHHSQQIVLQKIAITAG